MKTTDFSEILYRAVTLCGMDRTVIQDSTFRMVRDFSNQRIADVWEQEAWPDICRISQQSVLTDVDNIRYVNIPAGFGDILNVYRYNPRVTARATNVRWYLDNDGTNDRVIVMDSVDPVFIEYRLPVINLFGEPFSGTANYSVGAQVYFDTGTNSGSYLPSSTSASTGNFYTCLAATSQGESPNTAAAKWSKVEIPYFTADWLVRGVFSDYLRSESQFDSAALAEQEAEAAKMMQVDRVLRSEGQVRRMQVFTY